MLYHGIPPGAVYNDCIGWYTPRSRDDPFRATYQFYDMKCLAQHAKKLLVNYTEQELMSWSVKDLLEVLEGTNDGRRTQ